MATQWPCAACTYLNSSDRTSCEICNTSKPGLPTLPIIIPVSPTISIDSNHSIDSDDIGFWNCKICTYINGSDTTQCAMCGQKATAVVCTTCNEINDTDAESFNMLCKKCNVVLVMSDQHNKRLDEDTKRFLQNCINFRSSKKNAILLLCGYIREAFVWEMPFDITQLCIKHCYLLDYEGSELKSEWDETHIKVLNSVENSVIFAQNDSKDTISLIKTSKWKKPQTAVMKHEITSKVIRKVWRIKILRKFSKNIRYTFKIGLMDEGSRNCHKYQVSVVEWCRHGVCNGGNIKYGDVLSILFVNYGAFGKLVFGINDQIIKCAKKFDVITMHNKVYKFAITMTQMEEVQLLYNE